MRNVLDKSFREYENMYFYFSNILTWTCFTDGTRGNLRGEKICTMSHYR
jgi:hypothetical protein